MTLDDRSRTAMTFDPDHLATLNEAATPGEWFYNSYSRVSAAEYLDRDEEAGERTPEDCNWPHRHDCTACTDVAHIAPSGQGYYVKTCQAGVDLYEADSTVCTVPAHHGDTATGRHAGDAALIAYLRNNVDAILAQAAELATLRATAEARAAKWKAAADLAMANGGHQDETCPTLTPNRQWVCVCGWAEVEAAHDRLVAEDADEGSGT